MPMRFLLLLSAFLSAIVGPGGAWRPATAQGYQAQAAIAAITRTDQHGVSSANRPDNGPAPLIKVARAAPMSVIERSAPARLYLDRPRV